MKSLQDEYWALHEAAFELTEWPEGLKKFSISSPGNEESEELLHIYLPDNLRNSPKQYGKKTELIYKALVKAIDSRELEFKTIDTSIKYSCIDYLIYFVKPFEVIYWALCNDHILPKHIQNSIGIRQDFSMKSSKSSLLIVKKKFLAQLILNESPQHPRTKLADDVHRVFHGGGDISSTRKAIKELISEEGYTPKALPEVLQIDSVGRRIYSFPHLKEIFLVALDIAYHTLGRKYISEKGFSIDPLVVDLYFYQNEYINRLFYDCKLDVLRKTEVLHLLSKNINKFFVP